MGGRWAAGPAGWAAAASCGGACPRACGGGIYPRAPMCPPAATGSSDAMRPASQTLYRSMIILFFMVLREIYIGSREERKKYYQSAARGLWERPHCITGEVWLEGYQSWALADVCRYVSRY